MCPLLPRSVIVIPPAVLILDTIDGILLLRRLNFPVFLLRRLRIRPIRPSRPFPHLRRLRYGRLRYRRLCHGRLRYRRLRYGWLCHGWLCHGCLCLRFGLCSFLRRRFFRRFGRRNRNDRRWSRLCLFHSGLDHVIQRLSAFMIGGDQILRVLQRFVVFAVPDHLRRLLHDAVQVYVQTFVTIHRIQKLQAKLIRFSRGIVILSFFFPTRVDIRFHLAQTANLRIHRAELILLQVFVKFRIALEHAQPAHRVVQIVFLNVLQYLYIQRKLRAHPIVMHAVKFLVQCRKFNLRRGNIAHVQAQTADCLLISRLCLRSFRIAGLTNGRKQQHNRHYQRQSSRNHPSCHMSASCLFPRFRAPILSVNPLRRSPCRRSSVVVNKLSFVIVQNIRR